MSEHDRFSDECGAYVLGALEEHEAAALREHLESCVLCRDDVERLGAVAEVLGLGVPPLVPPAELRERVLDTVRAEAALFEAASPRRPQRRRWPAPALRPLGVLVGASLALGIAVGALVIAPGATTTRVALARRACAGGTAARERHPGRAGAERPAAGAASADL